METGVNQKFWPTSSWQPVWLAGGCLLAGTYLGDRISQLCVERSGGRALPCSLLVLGETVSHLSRIKLNNAAWQDYNFWSKQLAMATSFKKEKDKELDKGHIRLGAYVLCRSIIPGKYDYNVGYNMITRHCPLALHFICSNSGSQNTNICAYKPQLLVWLRFNKINNKKKNIYIFRHRPVAQMTKKVKDWSRRVTSRGAAGPA